MNDKFVTIGVWQQIEEYLTFRSQHTWVRISPQTGLYTMVEERPYPINGNGIITEVDEQDELIAYYGYQNQLFLYFQAKSYPLDPYHSTVINDDRLFRKALFTLKESKRTVVKIAYQYSEEDHEFFQKIADLFKSRNKEEVAAAIDWEIRSCTETDPLKREAIYEWYASQNKENFLARIVQRIEASGRFGEKAIHVMMYLVMAIMLLSAFACMISLAWLMIKLAIFLLSQIF
ncbi:hypothetical protein [Aquirhabdus parva]|nr:hypothetical protein [Aquirhabdus parva]